MGFLRALGFAAASTANHIKKDMQQQDRENKEWNRQFDEIFSLEMEFSDYLESVGSADILCNHDIGDLIEKNGRSAASLVKKELGEYRKKIDEFIRLGGDPGLIYDYTEIDDLLAKLKYLKSIGYMHWVEDKFMRLDLSRLKEYAERDIRLSRESSMDFVSNSGGNFDLMSGDQFEQFCAGLLREEGFEDVEVTKGSGDQGIDVLATRDSVRYGIQCKCYSSDIGNKAVQEAFAGKTYYGCHVAIVLTNRYFTPAARELASQTGVVLWDRDKLLSMVGSNGTQIATGTASASTNSLLHGFDEDDIPEIEETPNFSPLGFEELYRSTCSRLSADPSSISNTGHMISLLHDHIYSNHSWRYNVSQGTLFDNKRDALRKVIKASQAIRSDKYLHPMFLSVSAQSYFMLGYWKTAIRYYEEFLNQPGIITEIESKVLYAGELESAARIIHNICLISHLAGDDNLANEYRTRYEYVFKLERYRIDRIISNNKHLEEAFEKKWESLSSVSSVKDFFFDLDLKWGHEPTGDGMLVAIRKDCVNNCEACKPTFDEAKEIRIMNDGAIAVMDDETAYDSDDVVFMVRVQEERSSSFRKSFAEPSCKKIETEIEIESVMAGGCLLRGVGEYEGQSRLFMQAGNGTKYWAAYDCEDDNSYYWEYDKSRNVVRKTNELRVTY